jgi:sugar phosphate isomerase/epimerase
VKDSISEPSARHPFTYVMLGNGEFDLADTLDLLRENAFAGVVSIEWERKWHPYLPPLEEALKRARSLGWW